MNLDDIRERAQRFLAGDLPAEGFLQSLDQWRTAQWPGGTIDLDRQRRCGFPEVIYAAGKTHEGLCTAIGHLRDAKLPVLATRVSSDQASHALEMFPELQHNPTARTLRSRDDPSCNDPSRTPSPVAVVTAGASDRPVAEEALETLRWMGVPCELITDIGVAGPQRLLASLPKLRTCASVVVVAGMEGALPSAVGGHLACPVVAVPTSVGYGASFGGIAALLGMLNSCAANVTVVNIDAGFKGGYIAGLIAIRPMADGATTSGLDR
jgi:NCAIR mutase (PurE)-related protein